MVDAVRVVGKALGGVDYAGGPKQAESRAFRRSLFVSRPVRRGETLSADNVPCVRPAGNDICLRSSVAFLQQHV
jgi:N-acetylneuraminate synthase